jgi:hypothetical protein
MANNVWVGIDAEGTEAELAVDNSTISNKWHRTVHVGRRRA